MGTLTKRPWSESDKFIHAGNFVWQSIGFNQATAPTLVGAVIGDARRG